MGVMLVLEALPPARSGRARRRGHHTRTPEDQACLDALAAVLRYDPSGAGRCLSRLEPGVLAERLRPAVQALADAVDLALADT
jgi:hypothetical protein